MNRFHLTLSLLASVAGCASQRPAAQAPPPLKSLAADDPVRKYVDSMRDDLSRGKVETITQVMNLSAAESKVFWPLYQDYETELFALGDQRLELIRQFIDWQLSPALDDKRATELADGYFRLEAARLDLTKKYHGMISRELSPLRAAQFTQVEHRVGTVIDLLIASEMPLVQGAEAAGGRPSR
jgi:hypothetical protein